MMVHRTLLALAAAGLLVPGDRAAAEDAAPADAAAVKGEIQKLRAEVEELRSKQEEAEVKAKDAVVVGDIPGSFRVPGTDLSLKIYGFAELTWVHEFKGDSSDIDYSTFAPYVPLKGSTEYARKNRDYLTARTSRLGVEAATPTRFGVLSAKIEGDFNNEPRTGGAEQYGAGRNVITQQQTSSYGFRIRHAYGSFGGLLAGMTWSTFMDVDNSPETLDFNGPIGATFIRQPQIRYGYGTPDWGTFTIALENSSSYVYDQTGSVIAASLSRMPDVVARWDKGFQWGSASLRAVTQELRVDDGKGQKAARRGWGLGGTAFVKTRDRDYLSLAVTGGDGIGRYLNYIEGALYDSSASVIRIERAYGVVAGYQLKWSDELRVNLVYGMTRNLDNEYTDEIKKAGLDSGRFGINRMVQQAHLGPIWTPIKGVDLGIEGIWGSRKTLAGETGDLLRFNVSAKYYLN